MQSFIEIIFSTAKADTWKKKKSKKAKGKGMNVEARWFHGLADRTVHLPRAAPEWRRKFWISKQMVLRDSAKLFTLAGVQGWGGFFSLESHKLLLEYEQSLTPRCFLSPGTRWEGLWKMGKFSSSAWEFIFPVLPLPSSCSGIICSGCQ